MLKALRHGMLLLALLPLMIAGMGIVSLCDCHREAFVWNCSCHAKPHACGCCSHHGDASAVTTGEFKSHSCEHKLLVTDPVVPASAQLTLSKARLEWQPVDAKPFHLPDLLSVAPVATETLRHIPPECVWHDADTPAFALPLLI